MLISSSKSIKITTSCWPTRQEDAGTHQKDPHVKDKPQGDSRRGAITINSIPTRWVTHKLEHDYTRDVLSQEWKFWAKSDFPTWGSDNESLWAGGCVFIKQLFITEDEKQPVYGWVGICSCPVVCLTWGIPVPQGCWVGLLGGSRPWWKNGSLQAHADECSPELLPSVSFLVPRVRYICLSISTGDTLILSR